MKPSLILGRVSGAVLPTVVVFSLFLLLSGHDAPGGGFIGGLVAGAALVVVWATNGSGAVRDALPVHGTTLIGLGLITAQLVAVAGWVTDGALLQSSKVKLHLPIFGDVKLATPLAFDVGVYLVVIGVVAVVLTVLGEQEPDVETGGSAAGGSR